MKVKHFFLFLIMFCGIKLNAQVFNSMNDLLEAVVGTWEVYDFNNHTNLQTNNLDDFFAFFPPNPSYLNDSSLFIQVWDSSLVRYNLMVKIDTNFLASEYYILDYFNDTLILSYNTYSYGTDTAYIHKISNDILGPLATSYYIDSLFDTTQVIQHIPSYDTILVNYDIQITDTFSIIEEIYTITYYHYPYIVSDTNYIVDTIVIYDTVYLNNNSISENINFNVLPNPFNSFFYLSSNKESDDIYKFQVLSMEGRKIKSGIVDNTIKQIDLSSYESQLFLVLLYQNDILVESIKIKKD